MFRAKFVVVSFSNDSHCQDPLLNEALTKSSPITRGFHESVHSVKDKKDLTFYN